MMPSIAASFCYGELCASLHRSHGTHVVAVNDGVEVVGFVMKRDGRPVCMIKLVWNPGIRCWVGTICDSPDQVCP